MQKGGVTKQQLERLKLMKQRSARPLVALSMEVLIAAAFRNPISEDRDLTLRKNYFQLLDNDVLQKMLVLIKSRDEGAPFALKTPKLRLLNVVFNRSLHKFSCEAFEPASADLDKMLYLLCHKRCPRLEHFSMSPRQQFSPQGDIPEIAITRWPRLKVLRLPGHRATDQLLHLVSRSLPNLELFEFGATHTGLTVASAKSMAQMQNLKDLRINTFLVKGADIVDAVVHIAGQVPNLEILEFETDKDNGLTEFIQNYGARYPKKKLKLCRVGMSGACKLRMWPSCLSVEKLELAEARQNLGAAAQLIRSFPEKPTKLTLILNRQSALKDCLELLGAGLKLLYIIVTPTPPLQQELDLAFVITSCPNLQELKIADFSMQMPFLPGSAQTLNPEHFSQLQSLSLSQLPVEPPRISRDFARLYTLYILGSKCLPSEMEFEVGWVQEQGLRHAIAANSDCLNHLRVARIKVIADTIDGGLELAKLLIMNLRRLELVLFELHEELHLVEHQSHLWLRQLADAAGVRIHRRMAITTDI